MRDLDAATRQLPRAAYTDEAQSLRERLDELQRARSRGPQLLGNILPLVLAKLGLGEVQSEVPEDMDPS